MQKCESHEALQHDISHLQENERDQWTCINSIKGRITLILGGVSVSCVLLAINIIIIYVGRS